MCLKRATLLTPLYITCLQEHCDPLLLVYWRLPAAAKRKRTQPLSVTPQSYSTEHNVQYMYVRMDSSLNISSLSISYSSLKF